MSQLTEDIGALKEDRLLGSSSGLSKQINSAVTGSTLWAVSGITY